MKKLKEAVLRLSSSSSSSLSPSQIEDRFDLLFRSSSLCPPSLPPYAEMISAAIRELNQEEGSDAESVSSFIESRYKDLPLAHARFLSHHLKKLVERGEIVFTSKSRYKLPIPNNPNPQTDQQHQKKKKKKKERQKSHKGKFKTKHNSEPNGDLQLVPRDDELIMPIANNGDVGGDLIISPDSHFTVPIDMECFENPSPQSEKRRDCRGGMGKKPEHEHRGFVVGEEMVSSLADENGCIASTQLQLASVIETEPLQNPSEQNETLPQQEKKDEHEQYGEQELAAEDQVLPPMIDHNGYIVSHQLQLPSVIEMESLQNPIEQNETLRSLQQRQEMEQMACCERPKRKHESVEHEEQELVVKDQRKTSMGDDNDFAVSPESYLIHATEMVPFQNPAQQKELQKKQKDGRGRAEKVSTMSIGDNNNFVMVPPNSHLTPAIQVDQPLQNYKQQMEKRQRHGIGGCTEISAMGVGDIDNSVKVPPNLHLTRATEVEHPLQNAKQQNELQQMEKRQMGGRGSPEKASALGVGDIDNGVLVPPDSHLMPAIEVDHPLQNSNEQNEVQQMEKRRKDGRGRPKKSAIGIDATDNGLMVSTNSHLTPAIEVQKSGKQNELQQMEKKPRGCRGRPKKSAIDVDASDNGVMVPPNSHLTPAIEMQKSSQQNELQLMEKKPKGRRGRPKKISAVGVGTFDNSVIVPPNLHLTPAIEMQKSSQQIEKKLKGRRGRPRKISAIEGQKSSKQNELQQVEKKLKGRRGRPKKKPEPEWQGKKVLVMKNDTISSVGDHGSVASPSLHSTPLIEMGPLLNPNQLHNYHHHHQQQQELGEKIKRGRGRPKMKKQESEERQLIIMVSPDDLPTTDVLEMEPLQKQLPRRVRGRPPRKKMQEPTAAAVVVDEDESSLTAFYENTTDLLAIELEPLQEQQKYHRDVVDNDESMASWKKKKVSMATLKYLQGPQLPRRQLRPRPQSLINSSHDAEEGLPS